MKQTLLAVILIVMGAGLHCQWSTDPANPNLISSLTDTQVMPKTAVTPTGETWIAWMDNLTGTYYTYIQRLNQSGVPEFANPLLVSDNLTDTWLTEWDMDCDPAGNAVLIFQDLRLGTNNVVIYKISPGGAFLWGEDGIMLSNYTTVDFSNMSPTLICRHDSCTVAAWQRMGTTTEIILQSLSPTGQLQWGQSGISISSATARYTWPQLMLSDECCVLLKYYEDTGPEWAPTRKILVQKYNGLGEGQWLEPVVVQSLGGISAWTQWLSLDSDNQGGMYICWHDDRNAENISYAYVQRVLVNGAVSMQQDGVRVSSETGYNQFYPCLEYEPDLQQVYVFWNRVNANQNLWGIQMQKLSAGGTLLWTDFGMAVTPLDSYPTYPIEAVEMESGIVYLYSISPVAGNDQLAFLEAFGANPEGLPVWGAAYGHIAITSTNKLHYDQDMYTRLWCVLAWEDGTVNANINAMRLNYNGTLGGSLPVPHNLTATVMEQNNVLLEWDFPEIMIGPIGYKVYRNGIFFHLVEGGGTMQDMIYNLGPGLWSFVVTALFEDNSESPPSNEATINITGTEDNAVPASVPALRAWPNPCRGVLRVKWEGIDPVSPASLAVYDIRGRLVRTVDLTGRRETEWAWDGRDMRQVPAGPGVYLIRLSCGGNKVTEKIIKY